MKVHQHGKIKDRRIGWFTCLPCGAIFETEREDMAFARYEGPTNSGHPTDTGDVWYLACPTCGNDVCLNYPMGPWEIQQTKQELEMIPA